MAKVDCSGLVAPGGTFAGGTGMYEVMRWNLDCFWIECSASGPLGVWMETACGVRVSSVAHAAACRETYQAQKARHGGGEG
jgi:glyoxylate carboligase